MTKQEKQQLEKLKSYGSISVLVFAACVCLLTFFTTKSQIEAKQQEEPAQQEVVVQEGEENLKNQH